MDKKEELRLLKLLYNVIMDKTVQRRFETTITCDMTTGKLSNKRVIDECEDYIVNKMKKLLEED